MDAPPKVPPTYLCFFTTPHTCLCFLLSPPPAVTPLISYPFFSSIDSSSPSSCFPWIASRLLLLGSPLPHVRKHPPGVLFLEDRLGWAQPELLLWLGRARAWQSSRGWHRRSRSSSLGAQPGAGADGANAKARGRAPRA